MLKSIQRKRRRLREQAALKRPSCQACGKDDALTSDGSAGAITCRFCGFQASSGDLAEQGEFKDAGDFTDAALAGRVGSNFIRGRQVYQSVSKAKLTKEELLAKVMGFDKVDSNSRRTKLKVTGGKTGEQGFSSSSNNNNIRRKTGKQPITSAVTKLIYEDSNLAKVRVSQKTKRLDDGTLVPTSTRFDVPVERTDFDAEAAPSPFQNWAKAPKTTWAQLKRVLSGCLEIVAMAFAREMQLDLDDFVKVARAFLVRYLRRIAPAVTLENEQVDSRSRKEAELAGPRLKQTQYLIKVPLSGVKYLGSLGIKSESDVARPDMKTLVNICAIVSGMFGRPVFLAEIYRWVDVCKLPVGAQVLVKLPANVREFLNPKIVAHLSHYRQPGRADFIHHLRTLIKLVEPTPIKSRESRTNDVDSGSEADSDEEDSISLQRVISESALLPPSSFFACDLVTVGDLIHRYTESCKFLPEKPWAMLAIHAVGAFNKCAVMMDAEGYRGGHSWLKNRPTDGEIYCVAALCFAVPFMLFPNSQLSQCDDAFDANKKSDYKDEAAAYFRASAHFNLVRYDLDRQARMELQILNHCAVPLVTNKLAESSVIDPCNAPALGEYLEKLSHSLSQAQAGAGLGQRANTSSIYLTAALSQSGKTSVLAKSSKLRKSDQAADLNFGLDSTLGQLVSKSDALLAKSGKKTASSSSSSASNVKRSRILKPQPPFSRSRLDRRVLERARQCTSMVEARGWFNLQALLVAKLWLKATPMLKNYCSKLVSGEAYPWGIVLPQVGGAIASCVQIINDVMTAFNIEQGGQQARVVNMLHRIAYSLVAVKIQINDDFWAKGSFAETSAEEQLQAAQKKRAEVL